METIFYLSNCRVPRGGGATVGRRSVSGAVAGTVSRTMEGDRGPPVDSQEVELRGRRVIVCADATKWLLTAGDLPTVFTSLPDVTEAVQMAQWGGPEEYKKWFVDTAALILRKLRPGCAAVFYQSDHVLTDNEGNVVEYMDKAFLCGLAAKQEGAPMMWHKIALRNPVIPPPQSPLLSSPLLFVFLLSVLSLSLHD